MARNRQLMQVICLRRRNKWPEQGVEQEALRLSGSEQRLRQRVLAGLEQTYVGWCLMLVAVERLH
jgi:hypothetical protein